MFSKTSSVILEAALKRKVKKLDEVRAELFFKPDYEELQNISCKTAFQAGRYLEALDTGNNSQIAREKRKLNKLQKSLKNLEDQEQAFLNFDHEKHFKIISQLTGEINEIKSDLVLSSFTSVTGRIELEIFPEPEFGKQFGRLVRKLRIERNLLLGDMATALNISSAKLSSFENGRTHIPNSIIEKTINYFDFDQDKQMQRKIFDAVAQTNNGENDE